MQYIMFLYPSLCIARSYIALSFSVLVHRTQLCGVLAFPSLCIAPSYRSDFPYRICCFLLRFLCSFYVQFVFGVTQFYLLFYVGAFMFVWGLYISCFWYFPTRLRVDGFCDLFCLVLTRPFSGFQRKPAKGRKVRGPRAQRGGPA